MRCPCVFTTAVISIKHLTYSLSILPLLNAININQHVVFNTSKDVIFASSVKAVSDKAATYCRNKAAVSLTCIRVLLAASEDYVDFSCTDYFFLFCVKCTTLNIAVINQLSRTTVLWFDNEYKSSLVQILVYYK